MEVEVEGKEILEWQRSGRFSNRNVNSTMSPNASVGQAWNEAEAEAGHEGVCSPDVLAAELREERVSDVTADCSPLAYTAHTLGLNPDQAAAIILAPFFQIAAAGVRQGVEELGFKVRRARVHRVPAGPARRRSRAPALFLFLPLTRRRCWSPSQQTLSSSTCGGCGRAAPARRRSWTPSGRWCGQPCWWAACCLSWTRRSSSGPRTGCGCRPRQRRTGGAAWPARWPGSCSRRRCAAVTAGTSARRSAAPLGFWLASWRLPWAARFTAAVCRAAASSTRHRQLRQRCWSCPQPCCGTCCTRPSTTR